VQVASALLQQGNLRDVVRLGEVRDLFGRLASGRASLEIEDIGIDAN
jgi:hypothetical protein